MKFSFVKFALLSCAALTFAAPLFKPIDANELSQRSDKQCDEPESCRVTDWQSLDPLTTSSSLMLGNGLILNAVQYVSLMTSCSFS